MLSIKQLYKRLFGKQNQQTQNDSKPNICSISLSLNSDFDVDIFIEFDNLEINSVEEYSIYTSKIAEFLNVINTQYVTYTLAKLIMEDIGSIEKYKQFTDDVIQKWIVLEKNKEKEKLYNNINNPLIKPIDVFSKYYNTNK